MAARLEKSVDEIMIEPPNQPRRVERNWSGIGVERF